MGRKCSSIAARESAWLPSNPTRLPSTSKRAAIAAASCSFQAMRIRSYKRRTGWSVEGAVSVLGIQNNSFYLTEVTMNQLCRTMILRSEKARFITLLLEWTSRVRIIEADRPDLSNILPNSRLGRVELEMVAKRFGTFADP